MSEKVPFQSAVVELNTGILTAAWEKFYRKIQILLDYIQEEDSFPLQNNQSTPAAITPLFFDYRFTSHAVIEYVVQRCTTSVEAVESGRIVVHYLPKTVNWNISKIVDVTTGTPGFTVSINSFGQLLYTTTSQAGTLTFSRINYRVREIKAKSSLYSNLG